MPSKTIRNGKVVSETPATKAHPDGNRARTADGRVFDDQGHPVGAMKPAAPISKPSDVDPGED